MHINDVKRFTKCKRLFQLSSQIVEPSFSFYNICVNTDDTIKEKLHIKECYIGLPNQTNSDSLQALKQYTWLFKCRFEYKNLRIKVPLMYKVDDNTVDVYFIQLQTGVSNEDIKNYHWYTAILNKMGIKIRDVKVLYLNANYIRGDSLDCDDLWILIDKINDKDIIELINELELDVDDILDEIHNFDMTKEIFPSRSNKCTRGKKCPYYDACFPMELLAEDNSILNLVTSQYKYKMYDDGIEYLKDCDIKLLEGNCQQYGQIMADKNNGLFVDNMALKHFLDNIQYPISYFDFEWDLFPIPVYKGMKPMDVLVFQFALDVDDGKNIKHYQFIGENDSREEFVKKLIEYLPKEGSIIAYNAYGAESIRLQELANVFPQYKEELDNYCSRMIDLATPFMKGFVYDTQMKGLYSLKVIEGVINPNYTYHDLDCENGLQAVDIYRKLANCVDADSKEEYYAQLFEYCNLDSSSMIKVLNWLRNLVN